MFKGVVFALGACFIWDLIFIVPQFMSGFSSIEVALGRYLMYGVVSSLFFCKSLFQKTCRYPRSIWIKALYFSLISTIGYYTFVVLALRYSTPAICLRAGLNRLWLQTSHYFQVFRKADTRTGNA